MLMRSVIMKMFFAAVLLLLFMPLAFAQSVVAENEKSPTVVDVGIYVLNIGKFDVSTGSYTVDFYMDFRCQENCSPERFEFMNGRASSVDKLIDTETEKFYRIQATLSNNIDLRNYPFDEHALSIEIEDKDHTTDEIVYRPDYNNSGIDPSVIIVGWELNGWNASTSEHYYAPYDETYSRMIFNINIGRVVTTSVIKSFLPVIFMVIVALLSLLIMADKVTTRLTLNTSTLIAAVLFHVNLTSSIPPTGYLTFADKFMIVTYLVLIAALFSSVMLMRHTDMKDDVQAKKIYRTSLMGIPILTILLYVGLFLIF
jgi:hypothetical protein